MERLNKKMVKVYISDQDGDEIKNAKNLKFKEN